MRNVWNWFYYTICPLVALFAIIAIPTYYFYLAPRLAEARYERELARADAAYEDAVSRLEDFMQRHQKDPLPIFDPKTRQADGSWRFTWTEEHQMRAEQDLERITEIDQDLLAATDAELTLRDSRQERVWDLLVFHNEALRVKMGIKAHLPELSERVGEEVTITRRQE